MKHKYVWLLIFVSQCTFAFCEKERKEYTDWNSICETLSATSQVSGIVGGCFAAVTFGASLAPCVGFSIAAYDACCKKKEHRQKLTLCEDGEKAFNANLIEYSNRLIRKKDAYKKELDSIETEYLQYITTENEKFDQKIRNFLTEYEAEGWDLESAEALIYIEGKKNEIETERNAKIKYLIEGRVVANEIAWHELGLEYDRPDNYGK